MATPPPEATGLVDVEQSIPTRTEPSSSHREVLQLETSSLSPEDAANTVPSETSLPYPSSSHANQLDAAQPHLEHGFFDGLTTPTPEQFDKKDRMAVLDTTPAQSPLINASSSLDHHNLDKVPRSPAFEDAERASQKYKGSLGEAEKTAAGTGEEHGPTGSDVPLLQSAESAASAATEEMPRVKKGSLDTRTVTTDVVVLAALNRSLLKGRV